MGGEGVRTKMDENKSGGGNCILPVDHKGPCVESPPVMRHAARGALALKNAAAYANDGRFALAAQEAEAATTEFRELLIELERAAVAVTFAQGQK